MKMKAVTLVGQSHNAGVADAGKTTLQTRTIQVPEEMTFSEFARSEAYKTASTDLIAHPGVDFVTVKLGTSWPTHSFSSSGMNDAGEPIPA